MARPRPVFSARCTSLPLGVGSAGLATLAFAAPPPKGRDVQEDKGNLQKHFYTPRRRHVDADDVGEFLKEGWISRELEAARQMGLELMIIPDALSRAFAEVLGLGH